MKIKPPKKNLKRNLSLVHAGIGITRNEYHPALGSFFSFIPSVGKGRTYRGGGSKKYIFLGFN
jgi:hypothetical protein